MPVSRAALVGHWTHSHEEDEGAEQVYRPPSWEFPPARRGRRSFELAPDGALVEREPGPADRSVATSGRWELGAGGRLVLRFAGARPEEAFRVISADRDRLVLEPKSEV